MRLRSSIRLEPRWWASIGLVRAGCFAVTALTLLLDAIGIPFTYATMQTVCTQINEQIDHNCLSPEEFQGVQLAGIPLPSYAAYATALIVLVTLVYAGVGIVIFWRRSDDRMALLAGLMLVTFGGAAFNGTMKGLLVLGPAWSLPVYLLSAIGQVSFFVFFCLFPDGRFVPRWTRWTALAWTLLWVADFFPAGKALVDPILVGANPVFIAFVGSLIVAQVYRFRRVSNSVQRQQTKWVVFGFTLGIGCFLGLITLANTLLASSIHSGPSQLTGGQVLSILLLLIPLSIGMAILRSHLYDIDLIINRTLVYGSLTGMLALVYWGSVLVLQALLRPLVGEGNQLAIVVSTLVIAALFLPLRRAIQGFIDRRFYRRKYDAAKTLASFSATARDEVDLQKLTNELLTVIEETMQPVSISLWLRRPGRKA